MGGWGDKGVGGGHGVCGPNMNANMKTMQRAARNRKGRI